MEYQRKREHGTLETVTDDPKIRLNALRRIVEEKQYAKIDGTMIDLFTASAILTVYNAISDTAKEQFLSKKAGVMGLIAFKILNKVS